MSTLLGWAGLILGFSGLIFVHEFGHFILAKWHRVRVHVFSLGMGPYLVSFTWRGTVYVLSLIPIGGYVKLMGQEDMNPGVAPSRDTHDFRNKRPGQKAAILAAGAIFNMLFALLVFTACFWHGMYVDAPRIGPILPDQPLAHALLHPQRLGRPANLEKGDRILDVNGVPVKRYIDCILQVSAAPRDTDIYLKTDRHVDLVVVHTRHDKTLGASSVGLNKYFEYQRLPLGFTTEDHVFIGANPAAGEKTRDLPAARAGLQKGDIILKVADPDRPGGGTVTEIKDELDFVPLIRGSEGRRLVLTIQRAGQEFTQELAPVKSKEFDAYQIGILPQPVRRVNKIDPTSAAYAAGLREGDCVLGFLPDDPNADDWTAGQLFWRKTWDAKKESSARLTVPAHGELVFAQRHDAVEWFQAENFSAAVGTAWDDTLRYSKVIFSILRALFTGDVGLGTLSGPGGIGASIFHVASSQTFLSYMWWLAFISLNFGVFQFLPIPLLDGWHLVLTFVEKVKGRPVPIRIQEAFQYAGLFIVGALLILATYNDVKRWLFP